MRVEWACLSPLFRFNRRLDGLVHLRVAGATAEISAEGVANIFIRGLRVVVEQSFYRDHEPRSAITTLRAAPIAVSFLNSGQRSMVRDSFYRHNLCSTLALTVRGKTHGQSSTA